MGKAETLQKLQKTLSLALGKPSETEIETNELIILINNALARYSKFKPMRSILEIVLTAGVYVYTLPDDVFNVYGCSAEPFTSRAPQLLDTQYRYEQYPWISSRWIDIWLSQNELDRWNVVSSEAWDYDPSSHVLRLTPEGLQLVGAKFWAYVSQAKTLDTLRENECEDVVKFATVEGLRTLAKLRKYVKFQAAGQTVELRNPTELEKEAKDILEEVESRLRILPLPTWG